MAAILASGGSLKVTGTREEVEEVARRMVEPANSLERGINVASWILRVTEEGRREEGVRILVYRTVQELAELLERVRPRPHPAPLLQFLLSNQARLRLTFNPSQNPLIKLPEIYAKLYTQPKNPQYLVAIRAIHHAMKEADKDVFSIRSCNAILEAYGQARAFEDVDELWKTMRSEGGVGLNLRTVSVYFDACGSSRSLHAAVSTWNELQSKNITLNHHTYSSYQDCLNRCGAWSDLLLHFIQQQAQHLSNPTTVPPLTTSTLVATIVLATNLVAEPRQDSPSVGSRKDLEEFKLGLEVPKGIWREVAERIRGYDGKRFEGKRA